MSPYKVTGYNNAFNMW